MHAHHEGILAHTFSNEFYRVKVNGQTVGELYMNTALAGYHGVPVALVVGDEQFCREGREALGDVISVETKRGLDRHAAILKNPEVTQRELREAGKAAQARDHIAREGAQGRTTPRGLLAVAEKPIFAQAAWKIAR